MSDPKDDVFDEESGSYVVGSLRLRPLGAQALRRADKMGLTLLLGGLEEVSSIPENEVQGQMEQAAWLLSAPLEEVRGAMRSDTWEEAVEKHTDEVLGDLACLPDLMDELLRVITQAKQTTMEIKARFAGAKGADDDGKDDPPGN